MKRYFYSFIMLLFLPTMSAENPFVVIMYDQKTENRMGSFPPKRDVWAKSLEKLSENNVKAVVLKFFFDLPQDEDIVLAKSMNKVPVFLQARINEAEPSDNEIEDKFSIKLDRKYQRVITGRKGWIPVKPLSKNAYDIGFVDINDFYEIPLIEMYDGKYYKTLYFCILKFIFPEIKIEKNKLIYNAMALPLTESLAMHVSYPKEDIMEYIPLVDVLDGKINKNLLENKIAIIGYDVQNSERRKISTGEVNVHRVFIYGLYDMFNQLALGRKD